MYAIRFQTTDCPSTDGTLVSKYGDWHWIVVEPEGWVAATSTKDSGDVPYDVKTFGTESDAQRFAKYWRTKYHPWYGKPNGTYEFVAIKPKYKQVRDGYEVI